MNPDILAAVVAYLQQVMGLSLASSTGFRQVYADFAPEQNGDGSPVSQPYAVVSDGPESYQIVSSSTTTAGYQVDVIADGTLSVAFYATSKLAARALGIQAVRALSDTVEMLAAADGRVLTILPVAAQSVPIMTAGVAQPTAFARIVTFNYKQEFVE
jgi:hypothetical protein